MVVVVAASGTTCSNRVVHSTKVDAADVVVDAADGVVVVAVVVAVAVAGVVAAVQAP